MNLLKNKKTITIITGILVIIFVAIGFALTNNKNSGLTAEMVKSAPITDAANFSYEVVGDEISIVAYDGETEIVSIPETINDVPVTKIAEKAFIGNKIVKGVMIPQSVTYIDDSAFENCEKLEVFVSGSGLKTIDKNAFNSCKSLRVVELQEGLEAIMTGAFTDTKNLLNIYIPSSVKVIDEPFNLEGNKPAIITEEGSVAEEFAVDNLFSYELI